MNRSRFNAPPPDNRTDNRISQSSYANPPPSYNWQASNEFVPPNEYAVQSSAAAYNNSPTQAAYSQNTVKNNYCKTCNLWTSEPYESHITSAAHISKKATATRATIQIYEPITTSDQHMIKKPVARNNNIPYEPINQSQLHMPKKAPIRNANPSYEPITTSPLHMPKKSTARVAIQPFSNENDNLSLNPNNRRNKNRKNKMNINNQNQVSFHQNKYQPSVDVPHNDLIDNVTKRKVDEPFKSMQQSSIMSSKPVATSKGREMLLPVSGVYCTLCDEFFRNTNEAETQHCSSSAHLNAYEKLLGEHKDEPLEKRPYEDSIEENVPPKRPKCSPVGTAIKSSKPVNKVTEISVDNGKTCEVAVAVTPLVSTNESADVDQLNSSEFQGPDVSLEFPEEIEDYDEGDSPV